MTLATAVVIALFAGPTASPDAALVGKIAGSGSSLQMEIQEAVLPKAMALADSPKTSARFFCWVVADSGPAEGLVGALALAVRTHLAAWEPIVGAAYIANAPADVVARAVAAGPPESMSILMPYAEPAAAQARQIGKPVITAAIADVTRVVDAAAVNRSPIDEAREAELKAALADAKISCRDVTGIEGGRRWPRVAGWPAAHAADGTAAAGRAGP
jgi:hypothetical protein